MKTGEKPCSHYLRSMLRLRPLLPVTRDVSAEQPSSGARLPASELKPTSRAGDNRAMAEMFTCEGCNETLPQAGAMDCDGRGDFLEDTCPDCYWIILGEEGIIPNAAEAERMEAARTAIAAWKQRT
jgi:hypothetical protein